MAPTSIPVRRPLCTAILVLALGACAGPSPSATVTSSPASAQSASPTSSTSQALPVRCALTPDASPSATIEWNLPVQGNATIKAGQAVAFVTQADQGPTVTEGTNGTAAAKPCVDEELLPKSPVVVTFYDPGDYNIFCRKTPSDMRAVIHVQ
jgi:hypothetical protein